MYFHFCFQFIPSDHLKVSILDFFRSLLILDDIWDSAVLKVFDIHCRIILTTRNRSLANSVSGTHPVVYSCHYTFTNLNK